MENKIKYLIKKMTMRKFIVLFSLMLTVWGGYSQYTTVANETFGSIPAGWSVTPAGSWTLENHLYVSDSTSVLGYVPNSQGDSAVLISPFYDFQNYSFILLRFNHICKVASSDICKIYVQENHTGAKWTEIPSSCYQGLDKSAYQQSRFSQLSYATWMPNDSLAIPTNGWWKTESFDVSNEVSYAQVRFKFVITRGSGIATQFAYGWLIDDFELIASQYEIKPPIIEDLSMLGDTVYNTGPFNIKVRILPQTMHGIVKPVYLTLKYEHPNLTTIYDTIPMTMLAGDTMFLATIPQKIAGTTVSYQVYAYDTVGNDASIRSSFYVKRAGGGGVTGYVIVGNGTVTESYIPFYRFYDYSWSRALYLANELSINSGGGLISHIAYNVSSAGASAPNQFCYFKAVDDVNISNTNYLDPIADGATLVWTGSFNPVLGWNDITLDHNFLLPPGKNLLVYWSNHADNYTTSTTFFATSTSPIYLAVYKYQDGSFPAVSGTLYYNRPNTRFNIISGTDDTNSVGLYDVLSPLDSVVAAPGHQVPVVVEIKNKGIGDLDSCDINWSLNGVLQPTYAWKGYLPWDFNGIDTIGWYTPSVNLYDTLVIWVSNPNGQYDSTTYDDTLMLVSFGVTGLNMAYVSYLTDTVYNTGPFDIQAVISSRTGIPVPTPIYLHVTYLYDSVTTYDTILMNYTLNDTFVARIPQHVFGTDISYSVTIQDAVGNLVSITDGFYVKRMAGGSSTGYVIVGTGTNTQTYAPFYKWYDYSWSRMLYLASELNPTSGGGMITKLAWHVSTTGTSANNQTCYFKEVTDIDISNSTYVDPLTSGATLVWSGTFNPSSTGWIEITLDNSFILTPNKNLLIFWENRDGNYASPYADWTSTSTSPTYMTVYNYQDGSFPTSSGSLQYDRPNARFYLIGNAEDSNSVALYSIDYPLGSVLATPNGDSVGVKVSIKNKGLKNLTSCNISWALNGVFKGSKQWTGNLTEDFNDTITIGYYMPRACMTDEIVAWVSMPNGVTDSTTYDDTLSISVYGEAAVIATLSGPMDTVYSTGPYAINAKLISLTSLAIDTNVQLYVSYTYSGNTVYDTITMQNNGTDSIFTTILSQQAYGSYVTYLITVTDSLGNYISVDKWFYVKRPNIYNVPDPDSVLVTQPLNGGVFVIPFDCRLPISWSRVIYTKNELGISDTGAVLNWIAWQAYNSSSYVYATTRTNVSVYLKDIDDTEISITDPNYINPVLDGATLVFNGTMHLSGVLSAWEKVEFISPFFVPANKNIKVYVIDQHGTGGNTFAWTYYQGSGNTVYGGAMTTGTLNTYKPWTSFGFTCWPTDSDGVAAYALTSPASTVQAGIQSQVTAVIKNKGWKNLTSCDIDWTVNGVAQTTYHWTGDLFEDFVDTVTLGSYLPNPANYDEIVVWVSNPNDKADVSNNDDTLKLSVYAQAALIAEYISPTPSDTIYQTGPFEIVAHIKSLTSVSIATPIMYLSYTYNNVTTYDTVTMTTLILDSLYKVDIAQQPFGTYVTYSVSLTDSLGNVVTIADWFYIKRLSGGANTGYVIVGTATTTAYMLPMDMFYNYSWTRQLYLANELSPSSSGGLITKLAWQYAYGTPYTYSNQLCYMEAVDASVTSITSNAYVNPASVNASLVWSGTISLSQGWVEITLDQPFMLPPGKNLIVHWHHNNGSYAGSAYVFNYTATSNNTAVYCRSDGGFPSGNTGTLTTDRPNARFYIIGGGNDTNSVGFVNVLSPVDTIPAYQSIPIQVVIKNKGLHNLMSCNIDWTLNGVSQPTYNWTGNLMEDFTDTVILDYFTPIQDKDYEFTFRVSMPNNAYDSTTYDDTLSCVSFAQYDGYNLSMDKFISPFNNAYEVCYNKTAEVKIRLKNTGNYAILLSNNPLTLYYNVSGPVNFQTYRVITQGVIPVGTRDFVVDSLLDILFPGTYHIEVISQCGLDTITFDDTLRMQYEVKRILLPYDNDFSATLTDIDFNSTSDTVFWEQDLQPDIIPVYGNATLHFNSDLSEGESANAVLHAFDLQGCLMPTLEFWFAHDNTNPSDSDKVVVKISTNGGNTYSPIATVYRYNALFTTPGWQYYEIDLSAYSSESCVKIAFEAHSEGGGDMSIDRILISAEQEMSVELIIPQLKDMVACDLDQKEIKVRITNNTITPVDFDQQLSLLTLEASGAQTATYVDTLSGQIPAYTSSEFIIDNQFDFTLAGIYDFKAYINHIDVNTLNDTSIAGITIMPDVSLVSIDSIGERAINESVYLSVEISNTGNIAIQQIPLHLQIDGVVDVYDTADVVLAAGEDTLYTLKNAYKVPIEPTYQLMIAAELGCDMDAFNDSLSLEGKVSEPTLKVTNILKPNKDVCDKGLTEIFPQISIHNSGNPETDVVVYFIADKNDSLIASFVDTIALITNGNNNYNFKESYFVPNWETDTTYNVKAYIYSPTYALVQTACVIFNDVSIALADETSLNLGQNIPNPAQSTTSIPFYIPLEGNVLFTITSVSGQTLYTENLEVTAGSHMLEINIDMLANGIYYYSMQYKGQRLIKKMTIQK